MAWDHALAECLQPGTGVLRFYTWTAPTISLGRNQLARGQYELSEAKRAQLGFVRRPTGGGAVLHDREVTYAAVFPLRALGGFREGFQRVGAGIVEGLRELGVDASVNQTSPATDALSPERLCFGAATPGEIVVSGRKLVGSAQVRIGDAVLQHGSVLLSGDQSRLLSIAPPNALAEVPPVGLAELLSEPPSGDAIHAALEQGIRAELGGLWREAGPTTAEGVAAVRLREHYTSPNWTWRR